MQKKESNSLNQKLIDKIINVAYGDAGFFDLVYVHFKSISNNEIKSLLDESRKTAKKVHNIKLEEVPNYVSEKINNITGGINKKDSVFSRISSGFFYFFENKAVPATVFGLIFIVVISFFVLKEQTPTYKYSKAEIELAQKQFKQSLAIVGRTFQKAEQSFNKEVLQNQINKNLNRGYFLVNNILIGG